MRHGRWRRPSPRRSTGTGPTSRGGRRSFPTRRGSMPTEVVSTIEGVRILTLDVYVDLRGRFCEIFQTSVMPETFVQCNHSRSAAGVLRGLHYHQNQADLWYVPGGRAQVGLADL